MSIESNLASMGLSLPSAPRPVAAYRTSTRSGNLVFVAGTGPMRDGKVTVAGKVGEDVSTAQAYEAARLACLNSLAIVKAEVGSLDYVSQVVRAIVYVASNPHFYDQPKVADGATDLLRDLYGSAGLPARAAVGVPVLPMNIPVELELTVEIIHAQRPGV